MELDHLFMFIEPAGPQIERLAQMGFCETYRRAHPGQGTANVCYCFDNLYLELLWIDDPDAVRSAAIARTKLFERSRWRANGTCPFGLAWRGGEPDSRPSMWSYRPPYLPGGASIDVATDSDDPLQPMMFRSPGSAPPADWPDDRRGALQHSSGMSLVRGVRLDLPVRVTASPALRWLADETQLELGQSTTDAYGMMLTIQRTGGDTTRLALPGFARS